MTRLGQMIENEKIQYAEEYAEKYGEERAEEAERQMAKRMLSNGIPVETILKCSTLLSRRDIEKLAESAAR